MRFVLFLLLVFVVPHGPPVFAAQGDESRAVRLRLSAPSATGSANDNQTVTRHANRAAPADVTILGETPVAGSPAKQRNPQLSEDHLVIVGVDANGAEVARSAIVDPSLIRAESTDSRGRVVSTRLFRDSVDFSVILPNDQQIVSVQIFRPRWNGSAFELDLIGSGSLR